MCLTAWVCTRNARFPWLIASNRDEFFDRDAAPMAWWQPVPGGPAVLGGRDLSAGGTWQGLTAQGRLALLTNVREPGRHHTRAPSRGALVPQALLADTISPAWLRATTETPRNGFNLVVADLAGQQAHWVSNRAPAPLTLGLGCHGLSNAALDSPWPKVVALRQRLQDAVATAAERSSLVAAALEALADRQVPADDALPATGVPLLRERQLAPAFIHIPAAQPGGVAYGTRCATVVVVEQAGSTRWVHVTERRFDADARAIGDSHHRFALPEAAER